MSSQHDETFHTLTINVFSTHLVGFVYVYCYLCTCMLMF